MRPERPLRFLFLHSRTGGGHIRVARTVAEALQERYGEDAKVTLVDALAEYAPWPLSAAPRWYPLALRGDGKVYGFGFTVLNGPRRVQAIVHLLWPIVYPRAVRLLRDHPADVVVSFHPVPLYAVSRAMEMICPDVPLVAVGTDLVVMHGAWVAPGVRRYLVATEEAREQLLRHGVEPERIEVTGLPIARVFREVAQEDPREVRRRLGLIPDLTTVLVIGGGVGVESLEEVACAVAAAVPEAQMVVVAGQNERLRARLASISWPCRVRVEGFVENMHEWMRAADVLVTKAGPTTIAEAMTVGIPMVLWGAIPAQETPNVRLVVKAGAGIWAPGARRAAEAVAYLLRHSGIRLAAARESSRMASPEAAERVAAILWEIGQRGAPLPGDVPIQNSPHKRTLRWFWFRRRVTGLW
ncbi:MAG: glycosyltransferase [Anaerolineae bacterium]|nr:glycosyltransferase [Anaerolineae bacterium]MCX8067566.1 glycosyltransferase [Anaerolineae bacterium]MDW7991399.1 glycosyltransferase [Anaerolineae bacterium]